MLPNSHMKQTVLAFCLIEYKVPKLSPFSDSYLVFNTVLQFEDGIESLKTVLWC